MFSFMQQKPLKQKEQIINLCTFDVLQAKVSFDDDDDGGDEEYFESVTLEAVRES